MNSPLVLRAALAAVVTACFGFISSASAGVVTVLVGSGGDHFVPAVTNIAVNDQVVWSWVGTFHSTTSGTNGVHGDDNGVPSGLWDSGVISTLPHTFTNSFTSAGTFSYYCSVHFNVGMTGAVVVASANLPPTVSLLHPTNNAVLSALANFTVQASAADDGTVTNVQLRIGTAILTNVTTAPYSATTNLPAGAYTVTAIASDNLGATATNSVSISVVTPVAIALTKAARFFGTNFQFNYSANVGLDYAVWRSTNLVDWIGLATNAAASNPVVFLDLHATNNPGFYRVQLMPNP
ncbi:MAG TPA: Ig-like domain-containing protein [Verrucomicrobiae bacterium]|nr:Ig-like domain-containing protein [Verrucomicrobiae bacterium]